MKKLALVFALVIVILPMLAGCQTAPTEGNVTDDLGRSVQIQGIPQRIISLAPSNTEIVYALGLEDRLIGVTTYCNYPAAAQEKPAVSEYSNVDIEKIVALQPDLVLADSIHKIDVIPALERMNIPVIALVSPTLEKLISNIALVGQICGQDEAAKSLNQSLQDRIETVAGQTRSMPDDEKQRVFFVTWHDPLWTVGSGTMINDLIEKAGGLNIAADLEGNQTLDLETVIQRNPQVIFVLSSMGDQDTSYNYILNEPRFQATEALKNSLVFRMDPDIFGRTAPRIVDGLEEMAQDIHPEVITTGAR